MQAMGICIAREMSANATVRAQVLWHSTARHTSGRQQHAFSYHTIQALLHSKAQQMQLVSDEHAIL